MHGHIFARPCVSPSPPPPLLFQSCRHHRAPLYDLCAVFYHEQRIYPKCIVFCTGLRDYCAPGPAPSGIQGEFTQFLTRELERRGTTIAASAGSWICSAKVEILVSIPLSVISIEDSSASLTPLFAPIPPGGENARVYMYCQAGRPFQLA